MRRLYLDTGNLLRIADGKEPEETLDSLRAVMRASNTGLVIARAHVQDAVSTANAESAERFVRTIESFGPLFMIVDGPDVVEPLSSERADLVIAPCTNFRELVFSDRAGHWLAAANATQDEMHLGDQVAQVLRAALPQRRLRGQVVELGMQTLITLIRGWLGDDPTVVLAFWEEKLEVSLSDDERAILHAHLLVAKLQLEPLLGTIERDNVDVTDVLRRVGTAGTDPVGYPGTWLMLRVAGLRQSDRYRRRLRSDWVDLDHVAHFPYMDFATCDRGTWAAVARLLPEVPGPRVPKIFRNGQLAALIQSIAHATA